MGKLKYNKEFNTNSKNGKKKDRLYTIWIGMRSRCKATKGKDYEHYAGRGIRVCEEWEKDHLSFRNWSLANGYQDNLSIDRINNDGNYCPENCRWATMSVQVANQRKRKFTQRKRKKRAVLYAYQQEEKTLREWSRDLRCSCSYKLLCKRLFKLKWSLEKALSTPVDASGKKYRYLDEEKTIREWSVDKRCLVEYKTLRSRIIGYGWNIEDALNIPLGYNLQKYKYQNDEKTLPEWARDERCLVVYRTLISRVKGKGWDIEKALTTPAQTN